MANVGEIEAIKDRRRQSIESLMSQVHLTEQELPSLALAASDARDARVNELLSKKREVAILLMIIYFIHLSLYTIRPLIQWRLRSRLATHAWMNILLS